MAVQESVNKKVNIPFHAYKTTYSDEELAIISDIISDIPCIQLNSEKNRDAIKRTHFKKSMNTRDEFSGIKPTIHSKEDTHLPRYENINSPGHIANDKKRKYSAKVTTNSLSDTTVSILPRIPMDLQPLYVKSHK